MKTVKIQCRAIIQYLKKKGLCPKAVHEDKVKTYGEDALSYTIVKKWSAEVRRGIRDSIQDDVKICANLKEILLTFQTDL